MKSRRGALKNAQLVATQPPQPNLWATRCLEPSWAGSQRCPCPLGRQADELIGFQRRERPGAAKCRNHRSEKRQPEASGLSREIKRVPAVVAGGAERRKPYWPLHARVVRSNLT